MVGGTITILLCMVVHTLEVSPAFLFGDLRRAISRHDIYEIGRLKSSYR